MFTDAIRFGIESATGRPYVSTCRGTFDFDSVAAAADFIAARALARLDGYAQIWAGFQVDVERYGANLRDDSSTSEVPF